MFRGVKTLVTAFGLSLAVVLSTGTALAQKQRPMEFGDMLRLKRVSSPTLSPDGKWLAFSVSAIDRKSQSSNSDIWIMPAAGGRARQLTMFEKADSEPCWSPDSQSIAFVSTRGGSSQIWMLSLQGGEPHKVTDFFTDVSGLIWSPDGKSMAFTAEIYPDCPLNDAECNKKKYEEAEESKVKAKTATQLLYRHWTSWKEGRRSHIFVVSADSGQVKDVTPGDFDSPPFSIGGADYAFSADGKELAFARNTDGREEAWSTNNDIFVVPVTGGEPKRISTSKGSDINPRYSPDGKYLAWLSQATPKFEADKRNLVLYDRTTKQARMLTETLDLSVDEINWSPDSSKIYFGCEEKGQGPIYVVSVKGNDAKSVFSKGSNHEFNLSNDGKTIYFTHNTLTSPSEIYSLSTDGSGQPKKLTNFNDEALAEIDFGKVEELWSEGDGGAKVHSWVVKPPKFREGKKYPTIFLIHGGPQGAWNNGWSYRWNPQLFAAPGYVVVAINPRGSTGYGQQFTNEISKDWGGKVVTDINGAIDAAIKQGYVDPDRMGAAGGSYGGYMVNWLLGHSNRFKALVSHAGVYNLESMYGVTEELWFAEWEFNGNPWDNPELFEKWSPHKSAKNFKTPTLVIHGELDYRVPIDQGMQLFTALQRQGIPSKLVVYPDEGHWILKPANSRFWYKNVHEWFATYLKP